MAGLRRRFGQALAAHVRLIRDRRHYPDSIFTLP